MNEDQFFLICFMMFLLWIFTMGVIDLYKSRKRYYLVTLSYDPPYVESKLVSEHYQHGFTNQQHEELLEALINYKGPAIVSGYESDLYNDALDGWWQIKKNVKVGITTAKKSDRTEVLWMNYEPSGQMSLL